MRAGRTMDPARRATYAAVLVAAAAVAGIGCTQSASASSIPATDLISVTGECFRSVLPDRAQVSVGAQVRNKDRAQASTTASDLYAAALKQVKDLDLKGAAFETTALDVVEWTEYDDRGREQRMGFIAQAMFTVTTSEPSRAGEVIQLADKLGMQNIQGPRLFASDDLRRSTYESCLEEAVRNARAKAEKIARAAGGSGPGPLWSVQESQSSSSLQAGRDYGQSRAKTGAGEAPRIELQAMPVQVTVAVAFKSR